MRTKALALVLLSFSFLTACTAAMVGGAGAGGYAVGTDDRTVGVIANDVSITASIKTTFIKDDQIDAFDIDVDTFRGVVTLYGHVKSSAQRTRAVQLARTIKDVRKVVSKLAIIK
jgi:hyperosmotically inducible protein